VQYEKKISTALKNSQCLLIVLTKNACKHFKERRDRGEFDWVEKEIKDAVKHNLSILVIRLYEEKDATHINRMYEKLSECASPEVAEIIKSRQYCNVHLDEEFLKNDATKLKEDIDITLSERGIKKTFNWKKILLFFSIPIVFGLGYLGYNYNTIDATNKVIKKKLSSEDFGKSNDPNGLKIITCGTKDKDLIWSGWKEDKLVINKNDKFIYIQIHYYADGAPLNNVKLGLSNFSFTIDKNKKINISAFVTADNAQPILGSIYIKSLSNIELIPEKISFQENKCQSFNCETKLPDYASEDDKIRELFKKGINIGTKSKGNYGNLIIKFRIRHKKKINDTTIEKLTTNQGKISTLKVANKRGTTKRWKNSVHIDSSEILSFQIHYYMGYTGAINLKAKIDNLNGRIFEEDEKIIVKAEVLSDNLDTSSGVVEVVFDENVQLKFHRVSWQKTNCQDTKCESLITDNINNLFSEDGLFLGNVPKDNDKYYNGNLIVEYKVIKIKTKKKT
jgi:hypothetical protein